MEPTINPPASPTAADAMVAPGLQVSDHTSIDKAFDVLRGSHTDFMLIRDDTGGCAGIVTRDQLAAHCAQPWYTQDTRVRDVAPDCSPFARPGMPAADALAAMRERSLTVLPVVDDDGYALGILTIAQLQAALDAPADGAAGKT